MAQNYSDLSELLNRLSLGSGLAGLGGGLYNIFGKQKSPYDITSQGYGKIPGSTRQYYEPYMSAGKDALSQLMGQYGQLTGSTSDVFNKLASGYKESPGFQQQLQKAMGAAGNAQAAGGSLGTPASTMQSANIASDIAAKDFGDYMNRITDLYHTGLSGMGGINQMGFNANTNYADMLSNIMAQQANLAGLSQAAQNQKRSQGISQGLSGLMGLLGGGGALNAFSNLFR